MSNLPLERNYHTKRGLRNGCSYLGQAICNCSSRKRHKQARNPVRKKDCMKACSRVHTKEYRKAHMMGFHILAHNLLLRRSQDRQARNCAHSRGSCSSLVYKLAHMNG